VRLLLVGISCIFCYTQSFAQEEDSFAKANAALKAKNYQEAERLFDQAIAELQDEGDVEKNFTAVFNRSKAIMHQYKVEKALASYNLAEVLSKKCKDPNHYANVLTAKGMIYQFKNMPDSVLNVGHKIIRTKNIAPRYYSDGYTLLGKGYWSKGYRDSIEYCIKKAYEINKLESDSSSLPFTATDLGVYYQEEAQYGKALQYFMEGLSYLPSPESSYKAVTIYRLISSLFVSMRNYNKALEYAEKSVVLSDKFKLKTTKAKSLMQLGTIHELQDNFNISIHYYEDALKLFAGTESNAYLFRCNLGLAKCHLEINDPDAAEGYMEKARASLANVDEEQITLRFLIAEALYANLKSDFTRSKQMLDTSLAKAKYLQNPDARKEIYKLYADYYQHLNQYQEALHYKNAYYQLKDSLAQEAQFFIVSEMEAQYKRSEQDYQITSLNTQNQIAKMQINKHNRQLIWGGLSLLLLTILIGIIFRLYQQKKQKSQELSSKNVQVSLALKEKDTLLREIHHRVKNNLQVISSLLAIQSRHIQDPAALDAIKEGRNRVKSMALIHQNLYKKDNLTGVDVKKYFNKLIQGLFQSYNTAADQVHLVTEIEALSLDVDTIVPLGLIVNELISNALKHAFEDDQQGMILVRLQEVGDHLCLEVIDNGKGIEDISKLQNGESFGYELIDAFKSKLKADLKIASEKGTQIQMKIRRYKKVA
ncbi:MAG: histidine kinase dimerization/phosphoacceptor domain -containing protein, partial [Saprospiraceae bacterium]